MTITLAEFIRHVVTSAIVMGVGLGFVAYSRFRYGTSQKSFRRFAGWYVGLLAIIALLSVASDVQERRCPGDPKKFCRYNDLTPLMGMIVVGYFLVALLRSRSMNANR